MIKTYEIESNTLIIKSDTGQAVITYPCPIWKVVQHKNNLIVLLEVKPDGKTPDCNVYCLDETGALVWQIQDPQELYPDHKLDYKRTFSEIILRPEGVLYAFDRYSRNYVDPNTGKILKDEFTK